MDFDQQLGELQRRVAQFQEGVGRRKLIIDSLAVENRSRVITLFSCYLYRDVGIGAKRQGLAFALIAIVEAPPLATFGVD